MNTLDQNIVAKLSDFGSKKKIDRSSDNAAPAAVKATGGVRNSVDK